VVALVVAGPLLFLLIARTGGEKAPAAPRPPAPAPDAREQLERAKAVAASNPGHDAFIELSLQHFRQRQFDEVIAAARKALQHDANSERAYNNICAAYNELGKWDEAIEACRKALAINSGFQLAANNLNHALRQKAASISQPPGPPPRR
jgi:tetratricopeptide (TPR) repeat protein